MAIYRKIDCRISNDKKFRELSVEGKLAWYTILSRAYWCIQSFI